MTAPSTFDSYSWTIGLLDSGIQRIEQEACLVVSVSVHNDIREACERHVRSRGLRVLSKTEAGGRSAMYVFKHQVLEWLLEELLSGECSPVVSHWLHGTLRGRPGLALVDSLSDVVEGKHTAKEQN
jgi:hypothetical protein